MKGLIILMPALLLVGCNPAEHTSNPEEPIKPSATAAIPAAPQAAPPTSTPTPAGGGSDGVQIHGMGAGAATPVTGGTSIDGAGSGVGGAAKDQAKRVAGSAGSSSLSQMPTEEGQGSGN